MTEMKSDSAHIIKGLLKAWRSGDKEAQNRLFDLLYDDIRQISGALIHNESNVSLSAGDLVNEAVIRLMRIDHIEWADKAHFLAMAARAMRRVLIDHARRKKSQKRQHYKVTLVSKIGNSGINHLDLDILETCLIRLNHIDPEKVKIVEMRYFGGMTLQDIAVVKGVSHSTVKREWRVARAWLLKALTEAKTNEFGII